MALGGPSIYPFFDEMKFSRLARPLRRSYTLPEIREDQERNVLELGERAARCMDAEYLMCRYHITLRASPAYPYPADSLEYLVCMAERQRTGRSRLRFTNII